MESSHEGEDFSIASRGKYHNDLLGLPGWRLVALELGCGFVVIGHTFVRVTTR